MCAHFDARPKVNLRGETGLQWFKEWQYDKLNVHAHYSLNINRFEKFKSFSGLVGFFFCSKLKKKNHIKKSKQRKTTVCFLQFGVTTYKTGQNITAPTF